MSALFVMRLGAIIATALFIRYVPNYSVYLTALLALGMSHYVLSFYYAKDTMVRLKNDRGTYLPLVALVGMGAIIMFGNTDYFDGHTRKLLFYFGIHHTFNEVYLSQRVIRSKDESNVALFRGAAIILHLSIYLAVLCNEEELVTLGTRAPLAFLMVGIAGYVYALTRVWGEIPKANRIDFLGFEALGVGMAFAALAGVLYVTFLDTVLYHFVFWFAYPVERLIAARKSVRNYAVAAVGIAALLIVFSPIGVIPYAPGTKPYMAYLSLFYISSHIHITLSFALSTAQPAWIVRFFAPSRAVIPAGARATA